MAVAGVCLFQFWMLVPCLQKGQIECDPVLSADPCPPILPATHGFAPVARRQMETSVHKAWHVSIFSFLSNSRNLTTLCAHYAS
jgi:hypothetical protein